MNNILRYFVYTSLAFSVAASAAAQPHILDSLEKELKQSTNDTSRFFLLLQLANKSYLYDSIRANDFLHQAFVATQKFKWDYAYADYYENKAIISQSAMNVESAQNELDYAVDYYQQAVKANRNKKEKNDALLSIATCRGMVGELLVGRGNYKEAIQEYLMALDAWKNSDDSQKSTAIGVYYSKISTVYYKLNEIDKALEYDKLSLALLRQNGNEEDEAFMLIYVCDDFIRLHQLDSALNYLGQARPLVEKINNRRINLQYFNNLASISRQKKNFADAIRYYSKSLALAMADSNFYQITASRKMIGFCYEKLQNHTTARQYLAPALKMATEKKYEREQIEILQELVDVEKNSGHQAQAFTYLEKLTVLKDSSTSSETRKSVAEIENKYQAEKKGKEIIQLEKDKQIQVLAIKQQSTLNYVLIGSLFALLIIGILGYLNFRNRHLLARKNLDLQQKQISELEKDRQLIAVDSMLKGQEEERSRLARDLHDGLGGMLSGVKYSLNNMKDNLIITPDNMSVFERSLDMLDTSIRELRRVAHNMMPEMLTKFGLDEALREYCHSINATHLLAVKYQSLGMDLRLSSSVEIIVYRVIQELLNNIMKHAAATEAFVQLIRENNRLNVVVEDNGKGFDTGLTENSNGAGWVSIRSRIDYLKGQLDVHAEAGRGTLVNIEINLTS